MDRFGHMMGNLWSNTTALWDEPPERDEPAPNEGRFVDEYNLRRPGMTLRDVETDKPLVSVPTGATGRDLHRLLKRGDPKKRATKVFFAGEEIPEQDTRRLHEDLGIYEDAAIEVERGESRLGMDDRELGVGTVLHQGGNYFLVVTGGPQLVGDEHAYPVREFSPDDGRLGFEGWLHRPGQVVDKLPVYYDDRNRMRIKFNR